MRLYLEGGRRSVARIVAVTSALVVRVPLVFVVAVLTLTPVGAQAPETRASDRYTTWSSYLGSADSARHTARDEINLSNVNRLEVAWTFHVHQHVSRADRPAVVGDRGLRPEHRRHPVAGPSRPRHRPARLSIGPDSGAHWPRGGLLATAGSRLFAASGSDRTLRAYDRRTGAWSGRAACPRLGRRAASYEIAGRQYIVVPVAAAHGWNPARSGNCPHRHQAPTPRSRCPASSAAELRSICGSAIFSPSSTHPSHIRARSPPADRCPSHAGRRT